MTISSNQASPDEATVLRAKLAELTRHLREAKKYAAVIAAVADNVHISDPTKEAQFHCAASFLKVALEQCHD